ncbi:hypothetical protein HDV05_000053 [Chytridiales sp. JEL 0842]|nr:hypothetical protein HDV05_000053 [Chytridiales sp. JEL 0842]
MALRVPSEFLDKNPLLQRLRIDTSSAVYVEDYHVLCIWVKAIKELLWTVAGSSSEMFKRVLKKYNVAFLESTLIDTYIKHDLPAVALFKKALLKHGIYQEYLNSHNIQSYEFALFAVLNAPHQMLKLGRLIDTNMVFIPEEVLKKHLAGISDRTKSLTICAHSITMPLKVHYNPPWFALMSNCDGQHLHVTHKRDEREHAPQVSEFSDQTSSQGNLSTDGEGSIEVIPSIELSMRGLMDGTPMDRSGLEMAISRQQSYVPFRDLVKVYRSPIPLDKQLIVPELWHNKTDTVKPTSLSRGSLSILHFICFGTDVTYTREELEALLMMRIYASLRVSEDGAVCYLSARGRNREILSSARAVEALDKVVFPYPSFTPPHDSVHSAPPSSIKVLPCTFTPTMKEPKVLRTRQTQSCDRCRAKKRKCDGVMPCANCIKSKSECTMLHEQKKRGPKKGTERNANDTNRRVSVDIDFSDISSSRFTLSKPFIDISPALLYFGNAAAQFEIFGITVTINRSSQHVNVNIASQFSEFVGFFFVTNELSIIAKSFRR